MNVQIITAVVLSVALVGGTTWFKFESNKPNTAQLVTIAYEEWANSIGAEEFLSPQVLQPTTTTQLSKIDLISRQLFSDYIGLKSNGQATPENLIGLAEQYGADLLKENVADVTIVTKNQLIIITDSNQALLDYNQKITAMRLKYENEIKSLNVQDDFSDILNPKFINFMLSVSKTYEQAVLELKKMPVPTSLADNHLNLINNYSSSIKTTRSISQIEENPISALAALNTQAKNSLEEEALIANIKVFLISKGLFSGSL